MPSKQYRVTFITDDKNAGIAGHWMYVPECATIEELTPPFEPGHFRSKTSKRVYYVAELVDKTDGWDVQFYLVEGTQLVKSHVHTFDGLKTAYERIDHLA